MENKFYTIYEVSEMLGMHHKTIRKFISEGKLVANKMGKQWRISGHDLSIFLEKDAHRGEAPNLNKEKSIQHSTEGITETEENRINVSTVVDINFIDSNEYNRISNTLLAVMNCRDEKLKRATISIKYSEDEMRLRVMLWGSMDFINAMLDSISILTSSTN